MSNSVRSTTASSCRWPRVLPNASAAGAVQVPVAWTGRVMPLIVSSPSTVGGAVLAQVEQEEAKVTSGWFAASKNSAPSTCGAELLGRADGDRLDLRGALEAAVGQRGGDVVERAAEERDALVADGEAEARMDGIGDVGAAQRNGGDGHGVPPGLAFSFDKRRAFHLPRRQSSADLVARASTSSPGSAGTTGAGGPSRPCPARALPPRRSSGGRCRIFCRHLHAERQAAAIQAERHLGDRQAEQVERCRGHDHPRPAPPCVLCRGATRP